MKTTILIRTNSFCRIGLRKFCLWKLPILLTWEKSSCVFRRYEACFFLPWLVQYTASVLGGNSSFLKLGTLGLYISHRERSFYYNLRSAHDNRVSLPYLTQAKAWFVLFMIVCKWSIQVITNRRPPLYACFCALVFRYVWCVIGSYHPIIVACTTVPSINRLISVFGSSGLLLITIGTRCHQIDLQNLCYQQVLCKGHSPSLLLPFIYLS